MSPLRVGDVLLGFCNGFFGRDSYEDKRVEALGADWVVARDLETGQPIFGLGPPDNLIEHCRIPRGWTP
jgi:hypothetical protein